MKKLDRATLQRIKAVANEQARADFAARKKALIAEALRLQEAGEDVEKYLTRAFLKAVAGDFEMRFQSSTRPPAPTRAEGKHGKPRNITVSGDPSRAEAMRT